MVETSSVQLLESVPTNSCQNVNQNSNVQNIQEITVDQQSANNLIDHFNPSVRMIHVPKLSDGSCGFHLSRSKWDPYPWVSRVDMESPAEMTGVKCGDCVLEVNGEDILGMRITEVANLVRSKSDHVTLLLWTTGMDPTCNPESLCCGPMPLNLERLSASVSSILAALECPVCLDTIPPPCIQCVNGHLVCAKCSIRSEKCPVCRDKFSNGRSLIAEQVFNSITDAFKLNENEAKLREKLFGARCKKVERKFEPIEENDVISGKPVKSHTHTFLAKIMGKSTSVDNLIVKKTEISNCDNNMMKTKSLSLSTSEIFRPDTTISVTRCPAKLRLSNSELKSYTLGTKRPRSCNVSTERLNHNFEDVVQIHVPTLTGCGEKLFHCPCGDDCGDKIKAKELNRHILSDHKIPIITFGTSSAEIALPPRAPVENASLILNLDEFQFWLKLTQNSSGDIFISGLVQGNAENALNYLLEIIISNSDKKKISRRELIARNEIYDLENYSWKNIFGERKGISYLRESLKTTFESDSNIILRAEIKKIADI